MRTFLFFSIVIVAYATYLWARRRRYPDNYKEACVCGHRRTGHKSYFARCEVDECPCPEFVLSKKKSASNYYFMREEGPTARVIRFCSASLAMILVAILPRHILLNWAHRIKAWLDREEKKAEEELEEKEDD